MMEPYFQLRPMSGEFHSSVREVYADAIESQGQAFYTKEQVRAWSSLAWLPGCLDRPLLEGKGWLSFDMEKLEAFAVRYPFDRLALLYCRGRSTRRGHATALLERVELDAREEGQVHLRAEASFFSYPLLLRSGWDLQYLEKIKIGGVAFDRYCMEKNLQ